LVYDPPAVDYREPQEPYASGVEYVRGEDLGGGISDYFRDRFADVLFGLGRWIKK
jgi:hypothetical protein